MWYILDELRDIIASITKRCKGKYLLINQTFYKKDQRYGCDYFTNLSEMIQYFPWELICKAEFDLTNSDSIATHCVFLI